MDSNFATAVVMRPFGAKEATGIFLAFMLAMVLASFLASIVLAVIFRPGEVVNVQGIPDPTAGATILFQQLISLMAATSITIYLLRLYFPGSVREGALIKIGVVKCKSGWAIAAACFGFLSSLFFARVLGGAFPPNEDFVPNPLATATQTGNWIQYLTAFMVVGIAPITEELLFRGILYKGFSESWGKFFGGFLIFILFISVHNETLSGGYWVSITALIFISGFLLAAREISGSLIPPILMHAGFNFALVLPS